MSIYESEIKLFDNYNVDWNNRKPSRFVTNRMVMDINDKTNILRYFMKLLKISIQMKTSSLTNIGLEIIFQI